MTAIAYRDGIMAANTGAMIDRLHIGTWPSIVRRSDGALLAGSGEDVLLQRWFEHEQRGERWHPELKAEEGFTGLVVELDGRIWHVEPRGRSPIAAEFTAIGSAMEFLYGAMAQGASAEEAVRLAMKWRGDCGGDIQVEHLR